MQKLVSVPEMIAIEKAANAAGHTYAKMIAHAGASLAKQVLAHSHGRGRSVLGLVGPGNNGGDTLVALDLMSTQGWNSVVYVVGERASKDEFIRRVKASGCEILFASDDPAFDKLKALVVEYHVLLDGLLGTGIKLPLREPSANALIAVNETLAALSEKPLVVAVDCPSGMDVETGELAPQTLKADLTVCMAAVKRGMLTMPAFESLGEVAVGDIGLPDDLLEWGRIRRFVINEEMARAALPPRPADAHKGTFGTALIVAGSRRFPGAAFLAGEAAYRSGTGLVTIATVESVQPSLAGSLPEATWLPLTEKDGWIAAEAVTQLLAILDKATAVLFGPGFGQEEQTGGFLSELLKNTLPPLVADADALKLIAAMKGGVMNLPKDSVLTPHPGEMAILTGLDISEIQGARLETAEKFAREWQQVVVLKGAFTAVASFDGQSAILPVASAALARAGSGDVLAGIIAGLRAQGVEAYEAACTGVWLHGQAGLRAAKRLSGTAGVLAGDLIKELPALIGQ
ncbi:MAG: NAD(P)H-hydrate dehydratase [Anaerolineales bacterium]